MDTIEFVTNYAEYVNEIGTVIQHRLRPLIKELKDKDPHDLLTPVNINS